MYILNRYFYFILLIISNLSVLAQTPSRDSLQIKKPTFILAAIYSSDASYFGQTTTERLPYILAHASVKLPNGFFLSTGTYKLINAGSGISGVDLTAGYEFKLSQNLSSAISYSRSFYPDSSLFLQSTNLNTFSGELNYDWSWLTTGINADYIPGEEGALFLSFNAGKSIEIASFKNNDYISFDPLFTIVGSTQRILTTEQVPSSTSGGKGGGVVRLPFNKRNEKTQYRTVEKTSFNLLSYNLKLPVAYNYTNYTFEVAYQGTSGGNTVESAWNNARSFFSMGIYYMF